MCSVDYIGDLEAWTLYIYIYIQIADCCLDQLRSEQKWLKSILVCRNATRSASIFVETQPLGPHTEPLLDDNSAVTNNLSKKWAEPSVTLAKYFGQMFCHQTFFVNGHLNSTSSFFTFFFWKEIFHFFGQRPWKNISLIDGKQQLQDPDCRASFSPSLICISCWPGRYLRIYQLHAAKTGEAQAKTLTEESKKQPKIHKTWTIRSPAAMPMPEALDCTKVHHRMVESSTKKITKYCNFQLWKQQKRFLKTHRFFKHFRIPPPKKKNVTGAKICGNKGKVTSFATLLFYYWNVSAVQPAILTKNSSLTSRQMKHRESPPGKKKNFTNQQNMPTPPKSNIDTQNDGFLDVSPFKHGYLGYLCQISGG